MMRTAFAVGDKAVYPIHGITEVVALENRDIGGNPVPVYVLHVVENGSTIMVPQANAESVGLRGVITNDQAEEVLALLRTHEVVRTEQSWNRRKREYSEKLRTGSIYEIAEVMRDLSLLGYNKTLSFSERRMLETAKNLLVQEMALARGTSTAEVENEIDAIFTPAAA